MREVLEIGPSPCEEDCAQIGITEDAGRFNRIECRAYIAALEKVYGEPPEGSQLRVRGSYHEYGTYYEVAYIYDLDSLDHCDYSRKVEQGLKKWAEAGFWAPVAYSSRSQATSVITDAAMLLRDNNPKQLAERVTEPELV